MAKKKAPAGHEYLCVDPYGDEDAVGRGQTAQQARDRCASKAASILVANITRAAKKGWQPERLAHLPSRKRKLLKRIHSAEVAIVPIGATVRRWSGDVHVPHAHRTTCTVCVIPKSYQP
ncbi:MAG: hypothetical protein ACYTGV_17965 [Planctomycetota bacterium]|jgi:hypothetical protein